MDAASEAPSRVQRPPAVALTLREYTVGVSRSSATRWYARIRSTTVQFSFEG